MNIINHALKDKEKGLGNFMVKLDKMALNFLAQSCEGDARRVLSALELGVLTTPALQISEFVGMPEARIPLAQAVIYVTCAPKSNASYLAVERATQDIKENKVQEVPDHLKDASYSGAQELGHGLEYKYSHDYPGHYVKQQYMPKKVCYYEPTDLGHEAKIKERLEKLRQASAVE